MHQRCLHEASAFAIYYKFLIDTWSSYSGHNSQGNFPKFAYLTHIKNLLLMVWAWFIIYPSTPKPFKFSFRYHDLSPQWVQDENIVFVYMSTKWMRNYRRHTSSPTLHWSRILYKSLPLVTFLPFTDVIMSPKISLPYESRLVGCKPCKIEI